MKFKTLALLSFVFFNFLGNAQHLKRKGSFGVGYYSSIPDSISKKLNLKSSKGALINFIVPNSTAESLKLLANDQIVKINNQEIENASNFLKKVKQLKAGDQLSVVFLRNNKSITTKGIVKGKPFETSNTAEIIYDEFAFDNGYIRTILRKPKLKKPLATIYYLQGISCYSLDNMQETDPTKKILNGLVERGFAVYVVEKAGMGDSDSPTPCHDMGFNQELELFREGYKKLLNEKDLNPNQIYLFGHSLGGIVAPLLAKEFNPKGVVVYGTGVKPWSDYLIEAIKVQSLLYGSDLANLQDTIEMMKPALYDLFYNNKNINEIIQDPIKLWALREALGYDTISKMAIAGRSIQYHVELSKVNQAKAWKETKSDVLTMYGECDIAALYPDDHIAIVNYVNSINPGKGTYTFIPKTNHTIQEVGTMQEFIKMQENPNAYEKYAAEHFNWKVLDIITDWVKKIEATQPEK